MDEDEVMKWQDVLDEVASGRANAERPLYCPFCQKGEVVVDRKPDRTRIECQGCRRFIEGRFAEDAG